MTTRTPGSPDAHQPLSAAEKLEEDALLAGVAAAGALRGVEVVAVVVADAREVGPGR